VRVHRFAMWVGLVLIASFGLLILDASQKLQRQQRSAAIVFMPLESLAAQVSDTVGNFATTLAEIGQLRAQNKALREENATLRAQNIEARQVTQENARLRSLLNFRQTHAEHQYLHAHVVGHGSSNLLPMLSIDAGVQAGVKVGMTVIAPGGLVGRVITSTARWANVLPVNNPRSAVAAVISGTAGPATGMLQAEPGKGVLLRFVASDQQLQPGEWVLTSGTGGGYPPNIPIGIIVSAQQQDVALFQTAVIRPTALLDSLQDVLVMLDFQPLDVPS